MPCAAVENMQTVLLMLLMLLCCRGVTLAAEEQRHGLVHKSSCSSARGQDREAGKEHSDCQKREGA